MKEYRASTTINASPEQIWAILTDGAAYPEWEPNTIRIEGANCSGREADGVFQAQPRPRVSCEGNRVCSQTEDDLEQHAAGLVLRRAQLHAHSARRRRNRIHAS